jgi:hypothetical protein
MANTSSTRIKGMLQCDSCGRRMDCSQKDLVIFAKLGWPDCCGHVMRLYVKYPDTDEWAPLGNNPAAPSSETDSAADAI